MNSSFQALILRVQVCIARMRKRAIEYESRPTANKQILADVWEEIETLESLLVQAAIEWGLRISLEVRHALEVGVGRLHFLIELRKDQADEMLAEEAIFIEVDAGL